MTFGLGMKVAEGQMRLRSSVRELPVDSMARLLHQMPDSPLLPMRQPQFGATG